MLQVWSVLVVDDDPDVTALVEAALATEAYQVRSTHSAAGALAAIAEAPPDLVLLDLALPDQPGDELYAELKRQVPGLAVVFLTANRSLDKAVSLMRTGALDFINKPATLPMVRARIDAVRDHLELGREVEVLRTLLSPPDLGGGLLLGTDPGMLALARRVGAVARTDAPVLVQGESGTGKEVYARAVHQASKRKRGPFVAINSAAIPEGLWERELFGHKKGAFSDARTDSPGLVAAAEGGTLFLDEIGDVPLASQAKLLRFVQDKEYRPLGSTQTVRANVRIICATNRDLARMVSEDRFREDLYYRLNVVPVQLPPLRERRGDIAILAEHFLERYAREFELPVRGFTPAALAKLTQHDWPGNVRELENTIQHAVALATRSLLSASDLPFATSEFLPPSEPADAVEPSPSPEDGPLEPFAEAKQALVDRFEIQYATRLLALTEGNITRAAELSGLGRKTLFLMLKRHGIAAVREGVPSKPGRPRTRTEDR